MIFRLTARKILHFLIYMWTSICSLSNYLQNINAYSSFLKLIAEEEITLALLAEFYLLDLVRMGYSVQTKSCFVICVGIRTIVLASFSPDNLFL